MGRGRLALILAAADDASADAVGRGLRERGCRVVRAGAAELALAGWQHAPDGDGTRVDLPDGTRLDDRDIGVVLNRLDGIDLPQFARAPAEDRDYAVAEFSALLASWLNGLDVPVANPPGGDNAWAASLHPLGWHALAAAHGLATGDFVVASSVRGGACAGLERVGGSAFPRGCDVAGWYRPASVGGAVSWAWVFGEACVGLPAAGRAESCAAFVRALGLGYAALGFVPDGAAWRLVEVAPRPPLDGAHVTARCVDWLEGWL